MSFQTVYPHEMGAFWHFADPEHGLSPYWAVGKMVHQAFDGHVDNVGFVVDGREFVANLTYNSSTGIAPRPSDSLNAECLYEYKIHVEGPGEIDADFNISPRYNGMNHPDGHRLENDLGWPHESEGVDVHVQGSNLWPSEYPPVFHAAYRALADEAGMMVRRDYFQAFADSSTIYELEGYVRLTREMAMKLVRSDGVFYRIMHLLAGKEGMKWVYSGDNVDVVGKRHEFKLFPESASELLPTLSSGVVLKCYHPKFARSEETDDDPLSSPAFRAKFHKRQNGNEARSWSEAASTLGELQEVVTNVLTWANVPAQPDETTFVPDDHFEIGPTDHPVERFADPTPQIEANQGLLLFSVLSDLSPSGRSVAKRLATDGSAPVAEVAEDTDYSLRQVYRAASELSDVVRNESGDLAFVSEKLRQDVASIADQLDRQIESAATRVANIVDQERRHAVDSAFGKWLKKYGAHVVDRDSEQRIRFDTVLSEIRSADVPHVADVLEEGRDAWTSVGRDVATFAQMRFEAQNVVMGSNAGRVDQFIAW